MNTDKRRLLALLGLLLFGQFVAHWGYYFSNYDFGNEMATTKMYLYPVIAWNIACLISMISMIVNSKSLIPHQIVAGSCCLMAVFSFIITYIMPVGNVQIQDIGRAISLVIWVLGISIIIGYDVYCLAKYNKVQSVSHPEEVEEPKKELADLAGDKPQWLSIEGIGEVISVFSGRCDRISHAYYFIAGSYDTDSDVDTLHKDLKHRSEIELEEEGIEEYSLSVLHTPNREGVMVIVSTRTGGEFTVPVVNEAG